MKKECKTARNTVGVAMLIMATLLITHNEAGPIIQIGFIGASR